MCASVLMDGVAPPALRRPHALQAAAMGAHVIQALVYVRRAFLEQLVRTNPALTIASAMEVATMGSVAVDQDGVGHFVAFS